jgi:hypothetical protein
MLRTVLLGLGGFAAVIVAAAWLMPSSPQLRTDSSADSAFLAARVGALESALEYERERRRDLELELYTISEQLTARIAEAARQDAFAVAGGGADAADDARDLRGRRGADDEDWRVLADRVGDRLQGLQGLMDPDAVRRRQVDRLVSAGFSPDQAEWIERRTEELRMEQLSARYEAARSGQALDAGELPGTDAVLRAELGDADYERYLSALNRPTSVGVNRVLASSPAESAGLQPGDQITSYGGQRVFNMTDLNEATLQGTPGQTVVVEVLRNGQPMQLYLPRGPVGIVGGMAARVRPGGR